MAINLGLISTATNAALSLSNLVLATPLSSNPGATKGYQPLVKGAPASFALPKPLLFHYEDEQTFSFESDITDHYVENNTAIQDQIALKPEIVTTTGFIGELNDVVPDFLKPLQTVAETLTTISAYTPSLSITALLAYNKAILLYETAANAVNSSVAAFSSISSVITGNSGNEVAQDSGVFQSGNSIIQNKQQQMFQQLYGYWANRTLFNVQTPWAIITNMAIQGVKAVQTGETRMVTDYQVTFKKIRTASTKETPGGLGQMTSGRATSQVSELQNQGTSSGVSGTSLGTTISGMLG